MIWTSLIFLCERHQKFGANDLAWLQVWSQVLLDEAMTHFPPTPPQIDGEPLGLRWFLWGISTSTMFGCARDSATLASFWKKTSGNSAILVFFFKKKHLRNPKENVFLNKTQWGICFFFPTSYSLKFCSDRLWNRMEAPTSQMSPGHRYSCSPLNDRAWVAGFGEHPPRLDRSNPTSPKKNQGFIPRVVFVVARCLGWEAPNLRNLHHRMRSGANVCSDFVKLRRSTAEDLDLREHSWPACWVTGSLGGGVEGLKFQFRNF